MAKRPKSRATGSSRRQLVAAPEEPRIELNDFQKRLIQQVCDALWLPSSLSPVEISARAQAAIDALRGIKPADELEGMLAVQMIANHSAAMDCLQRASNPDERLEVREMNLRHTHRLMSLYLRQFDAFEKRRAKHKPALPEPTAQSRVDTLTYIEELLDKHLPKSPTNGDENRDADQGDTSEPASLGYDLTGSTESGRRPPQSELVPPPQSNWPAEIEEWKATLMHEAQMKRNRNDVDNR